MIPYRHSVQTVSEVLKHPGWLSAYFRHSMDGFANYKPYAGDNASMKDVTAFVRRESGGSFTWDEVKRFRTPGRVLWWSKVCYIPVMRNWLLRRVRTG